MKTKLLIVAAVTTALAVACSDKKRRSSSGGAGSHKLILTSDAVNLKLAADKNCNISESISAETSGICTTPLNVKGAISAVYFDTVAGNGKPPARMLAGSESLKGLESTYFSKDFNFANPPVMESNNNLTEDKIDYDLIQVSMKYLEVKFAAAGKYFNVRYTFITQPPLSNTTLDNCVTSSEHRAEVTTRGTLLSDSAFVAGDILVCVTDTATKECANTEYKFIDSSTFELSSTRPTSPLKLSGKNLLQAETCVVENGRPSISPSYMNFNVKVAEKFSLTAKWKDDEPVQVYTHTSAEGKTTQGTSMTVTLNFDLENSLFVPQGLTLADATESAVLAKLDKILLLPLYVRNYSTAVGDGFEPHMTGKASVELK